MFFFSKLLKFVHLATKIISFRDLVLKKRKKKDIILVVRVVLYPSVVQIVITRFGRGWLRAGVGGGGRGWLRVESADKTITQTLQRCIDTMTSSDISQSECFSSYVTDQSVFLIMWYQPIHFSSCGTDQSQCFSAKYL